jgi:hypothetical protein
VDEREGVKSPTLLINISQKEVFSGETVSVVFPQNLGTQMAVSISPPPPELPYVLVLESSSGRAVFFLIR